MTARESASSIVKYSRDQSHEAPSRRIWRVIAPPDCSFHAHTRSTNFSRPRSWRDVPSGFELALDHHLRRDARVVGAGLPQRVVALHAVPADSTSISVCWNACPMCSVPVTLGGGSWMQNGRARGASTALNQPRDSHNGYQCASMAWGSKLLASSMEERRRAPEQKREIIAEPPRRPARASLAWRFRCR